MYFIKVDLPEAASPLIQYKPDCSASHVVKSTGR
jgi:hypothetical protein